MHIRCTFPPFTVARIRQREGGFIKPVLHAPGARTRIINRAPHAFSIVYRITISWYRSQKIDCSHASLDDRGTVKCAEVTGSRTEGILLGGFSGRDFYSNHPHFARIDSFFLESDRDRSRKAARIYDSHGDKSAGDIIRPQSNINCIFSLRTSRFINRILCYTLIVPFGALCSSRSELVGCASACIYACGLQERRSGVHVSTLCAGRSGSSERSGKDFFTNGNQEGQRRRIRTSWDAHNARTYPRAFCRTAVPISGPDVREYAFGQTTNPIVGF